MYRFAVLLSGLLMMSAVSAGAADEPYRPNRLTPVDENNLPPEVQRSLQRIESIFGSNKVPAGPFSVLMHKESFTEGAVRLYKATREAKLAPRLFELSVIVVGRQWDSDFEWNAHHANAVKLGIPADAVEAIRLGKTPKFAQADEEVTYEVATELLSKRKLSQKTYDKAVGVLGEQQMIELVAATGFYTMIAMTVNAFDVQIPPPAERHPLPPMKH